MKKEIVILILSLVVNSGFLTAQVLESSPLRPEANDSLQETDLLYQKQKEAVIETGEKTTTIADMVAIQPQLLTFTKILNETDIRPIFEVSDKITVFAPSDNAFSKLKGDNMQILYDPDKREQLISLMGLHVVKGELRLEDLKHGDILTSMGGKKLKVVKRRNKVFIDGVEIIKENIEASNGLIHMVDRVIVPERNAE